MRPRLRFGVIGDAWRLYWDRWWTWSMAMLIVMAAYSVVGSALFKLLGGHWPGGVGGFRMELSRSAGVLHSVGTSVVASFCLGGLIRMASHQVRGGRPQLGDLFSVLDVGFQLLAGSVFYSAATFLGMMLCVIPALIIAGLLMFLIPLIVIARFNAVDAFAESWQVLRSEWLTATVLHFVLGLIAGFGALFCCVGLLVTGPLYSLSIALLFHEFYEPTRASSTRIKKPPPVDPYDAF